MKLSRNQRAVSVAFGCALMLLATYGIGIVTLSLYVSPLADYFNVSNAAISPMLTIWGIGSFILAYHAGKIIDKIGVHNTVVIGGIGGFLTFMTISMCESIWMCYLAGLFMPICGILSGYTVTQATISMWYKKGRATVNGLVGLGEGFGGASFALIVGNMIAASPEGFRDAARLEAIVILIVAVVSGQVFMRGVPEDYGFTAIGGEEIKKEGPITKDDLPGITEKEAKRTPVLWILFVAIIIYLIAQYMVVPQQAAMLTDFGYTTMQAAVCVSVYSVAKVANRLLFGIVSDAFGLLVGVGYCSGSMIIGLAILLTTQSYVGAIIFSIFLGFGASASGNYGALVIARLFGRKDLPKLTPLAASAAGMGVAVGPMMFSLVYSIGNSSYMISSIVAMIFLIIVFIMNLYVVRNKNFFEKEDWYLKRHKK